MHVTSDYDESIAQMKWMETYEVKKSFILNASKFCRKSGLNKLFPFSETITPPENGRITRDLHAQSTTSTLRLNQKPLHNQQTRSTTFDPEPHPRNTQTLIVMPLVGTHLNWY